MKTEFIDVSDTKKNLVVEIPSTVVDAEIDKVSRDYSTRGADSRLPAGQGAGQGRPPAVPRSDPARRCARSHPARRGRCAAGAGRRAGRHAGHPDVVVEEGQPLKFTATFDTVPPIDPGDYASITLRRKPVHVEDAAVEEALGRLRDRAARYEPVEGRGIENGRLGPAGHDSDGHGRTGERG